jgi:proteasome lid subunit RPN8/RPN11
MISTLFPPESAPLPRSAWRPAAWRPAAWRRTLRGSFAALAIGLLGACGSIPLPTGGGIQPEAAALLDQSQQAHGKAAFAALNDINVSYGGEWFDLIKRIQPAITDAAFRQTSQERMVMKGGSVLAQIHSGPGGQKTVLETDRSKVSVWYNGEPYTGADQQQAAHLVIHAYQLFLYPAFYVQRASVLERAGTSIVNGRDCDVLLAVLRPGIGNSKEDRVLLSIDRQDKLVRRVWLTLEGSEPSQGAVVSVVHDQFVKVGGVTWPTHFYETVVRPFAGLPAHDFYLTGLDLNRGLGAADFAGGKFSERAARPAAALVR